MIPDGITSIGSNTFNNCSSLSLVVIPDSVTSIEGGAFHGCTSLEKVFFKGSVQHADSIAILNPNYQIKNVSWYCYSENGQNEQSAGNWWYYDTDGKTIIEKIVV